MKRKSSDNSVNTPAAEDIDRQAQHQGKRQKSKKHIAAKVGAVLVILLAIEAIALVGMFFHGSRLVNQPVAEMAAENEPARQTIQYNGESYMLNKDVVTILLIGHDDSAEETNGVKANEADAVMAFAINTATGEMTAIGLPRDTMCLVDQYVHGEFAGTITEQLCLAYGYGETPEKGSENVLKSASSIMGGVPIKYYYTIDEEVIAKLNDEVGGVNLTALETIPSAGAVEGEEVLLLGEAAHEYVRYRDTSQLGSSRDRMYRQVQYIKAFAEQAFGNPVDAIGKSFKFLSIAANHSTTNMSPSEAFYLSCSMAKGAGGGINMASVDGIVVQNGRYAETDLDLNALHRIILDTYYTKVASS